jgi:hypothetical protein
VPYFLFYLQLSGSFARKEIISNLTVTVTDAYPDAAHRKSAPVEADLRPPIGALFLWA